MLTTKVDFCTGFTPDLADFHLVGEFYNNNLVQNSIRCQHTKA